MGREIVLVEWVDGLYCFEVITSLIETSVTVAVLDDGLIDSLK